MKQELDTIGFAFGFVVFVVGVSMYSVRLAFVAAGLIICGLSAALGLSRIQKAKRRDS